jgi:hypothetical protein
MQESGELEIMGDMVSSPKELEITLSRFVLIELILSLLLLLLLLLLAKGEEKE